MLTMNVIKIKPLCLLGCLLIILVFLNTSTAKNQKAQCSAFGTIEKHGKEYNTL
ncbi:hypothetical protein J2X77_000260 [Sphingobacterium sp. 2149]|nr:hypothetical protein [Sphingobacterium sp. 2149]